jgi:hypothetical protein
MGRSSGSPAVKEGTVTKLGPQGSRLGRTSATLFFADLTVAREEILRPRFASACEGSRQALLFMGAEMAFASLVGGCKTGEPEAAFTRLKEATACWQSKITGMLEIRGVVTNKQCS